jgi:hypothetical protein
MGLYSPLLPYAKNDIHFVGWLKTISQLHRLYCDKWEGVSYYFGGMFREVALAYLKVNFSLFLSSN